MMSAPHRLVIVGNGMSGARLAEHVLARQGDRRFDIVIFGDEPGGNYNRILLSEVLAGTHNAFDIVTNPPDWYAANGIDLRAGVRVQRIDLAARQVIDECGNQTGFDSLVLATGSRPVLPPIRGLLTGDGSLVPGAFVFRTAEDCARMAAAASDARHVVVIGGGLLGLEAARGLLGHGLQVSVVHIAPHVMESQLDATGGGILRRQLESMGLRVLTNKSTTEVIGDTHVKELRFSDGSTEPCDLLVVAAGVRANVELAKACGLTVGRGIVVGDDLSCEGAPGVYAIGDCVEHRGKVYGLVAPAWEQADVLADRLTGHRAEATYGGSRLATKLKVAGVDVAVMGERDAHDDDEVVSYSEAARGIYGKLIVRDERVLGAILIGAAAAVPSVVQRTSIARRCPQSGGNCSFRPPVIRRPAASIRFRIPRASVTAMPSARATSSRPC